MTTKPPKAYVVTAGEYDSYRVIAVFTDKKLAQQRLDEYMASKEESIQKSTEWYENDPTGRQYYDLEIQMWHIRKKNKPTTRDIAIKDICRLQLETYSLNPESISDN